MKNLLIILLSACVGALLTMMLTKSCQAPQLPEIITERDTIVITKIDTVVTLLPQPVKVVRDTISLTDTIYIGGQMLFQEIKEYQDSTYYARISGINAYLQEIRVYPRTVINYVNTTEKVYIRPPKWSIGLQGGYGITPRGLQPYIGVGFSYQLKF